MMHCILFLAVIAAANSKLTTESTAVGYRSTYQERSEECSNITNLDFDSYRNGNLSYREFYKSQEFKCYHRCMSIKSGLIDEDGKPNIDVVRRMYGLNKTDNRLETVKNCTSRAKDECDKANDIIICIQESTLPISVMKYLDDRKTCINESKLDFDILFNSNISYSEFQKLHEVKCYKRCLDVKQGFMDSSGKMNFTRFAKMYWVNESSADFQEAKTCKSDAVDVCDNAFEIRECVNNKINPITKFIKIWDQCKNETINNHTCLPRCIHLKEGLINESGEPIFDKIKEIYWWTNKTRGIENAKQCTSNATDMCIKDREIFSCIYKSIYNYYYKAHSIISTTILPTMSTTVSP